MQNVGELKVNNNKGRGFCFLTLFDMFDQTAPHTLDKIMAKLVPMENNLKA